MSIITDNVVTVGIIVNLISALSKGEEYPYINASTHTVVSIEEVIHPYGPIMIKRWNPTVGETRSAVPVQSISMAMMNRVANAISEGTPINIDRLLGASYNTRSALETLLCHTPPFYYCYPGRIELMQGKTKIKSGHKHIIYLPEEPHKIGELCKKDLEHLEINEIPSRNVVYNALELPTSTVRSGKVDTDEVRIHSQMQMAIYEIGSCLSLKTFIAQNDTGIRYKGKLLSEHDNIVTKLNDIPTIGAFDGAVNAGKLIDAIWLGSKSIPAVFEVEQSTGVTSGLTRMSNFKKTLPEYRGMRYIIVAPDEYRDKVVREINKPEFADLHAFYMPYSSVSELLGLCQERKLKGITEEFIETFLDDVYAKN
jgi:type II restriction enzyme